MSGNMTRTRNRTASKHRINQSGTHCRMKRLIACFALLGLVSISHAANITNLVTDGDFESPNGDVGPWANMFGGDSISFSSTGGNPNGCLQISDPGTQGAYGGVAYVNPPDMPLSALGLVAGQT